MTASVIDLENPAAVSISQHRLIAGAAVGAAALLGFGLILWIAANWEGLGRFGRFGLVGTALVVSGLGAVIRPSLKVPSLLVAFCAAGGMLALIGQTYQTGADAWQLFAAWAVLTLPWCLAARSDAIWTPWAIVSFTALALFQHSYGGFDAVVRGQPVTLSIVVPGSPAFMVAASWLCALALCAALGPHARFDAWLGSRRWAFRIAMLLTLLKIATFCALAILVAPSVRGDLASVGFLLLAATFAILAAARRRDALMLAGTALAIDVTLISAVARLVIPSSPSFEWGSFFLIGLCAAAIVAASVVGLMRLIAVGTAEGAVGQSTRLAPRVNLADGARPWPAVVLSGIGALLAAIPFIVALALLLGRALEKGAGAYIIGLLAAAAGVAGLRQAKGLFVEQIAAIAFTIGLLLVGYALFRDLPVALACVVIGASATAIGLWLGKPWAAGWLGAVAAAGFAGAIAHIIGGTRYRFDVLALTIAWMLVVAAWVAVVLAAREGRLWLEPLRAHSAGEAMLVGSIGAVLIGLSWGAGPTFLMGVVLGSGRTVAGFGFHTALDLAARGAGLAMAIGGAVVLYQQIAVMRSAVGMAIMATIVGLSWLVPALGAAALVLVIALVTGRRAVAVAAAVAGLWIAGSFYYDLSLSLTEKAALLGLAGTLLGAVALIAGARPPVLPSAPHMTGRDVTGRDVPGRGAAGQDASLALVRALAALGLVAATGLSAQAIHQKETLIRDGRPVFVELAPVDPRSLMQGDYMALRFELPVSTLRHQPIGGERPLAIGKVDDKGVLRLTRIGTATTPLVADEMKISLGYKNGRWILVTDAWFFPERTAGRWEKARFGEFRVHPDGSALLVGMADKDLTRIE